MELVDIMDKNGNPTGEILSKDEAHDRNLPHNEVGVWLINDQNQTLMQKRAANKRFNPNKWAICAGHVSAGEDVKHAALRELKEELGIDFTLDDLQDLIIKLPNIREDNSLIAYTYYIRCNLPVDAFTIEPEELTELKWMNIDELLERVKSGDPTIVTDLDPTPFILKLKEL